MLGALPSVLHLLAPARFGGLESVVLMLARGQIEAGQRVTLGAFVDPDEIDHPFLAAAGRAGVPATPVPTPARGYLAERRAVRDLIDDLGPDVVHTHGYRPDVVDSGVARRLGAATVTTVHGFTGFGLRGRLYEWVQRRWFRRFDAVVAVSEALRRDLERSGVQPSRLHTIQNAWQPARVPLARSEARRALGLDAEGPVAGWVGRLSPEKGPDVMVEALATCSRPDVVLSVVGTGPLDAQLRALASERGVAHRVRWHGVVPEAGSYLRAFDVLLLTSWTEGTPIVLLEAMAAGTPVIATAVGGVPDVVSDREAALVPPGDAAALARRLEELLSDPASGARRSEEARRRLAGQFAIGPWVARYMDVYGACV